MKLVMPNAAKAAKTRCEIELEVISSIPCLVSQRPFRRMNQSLQGPCQFEEMAEFCGFRRGA